MTIEYTARFLTYHSDNPHIYPLFEKYAFQALAAGRKHLSSKLIFERIRWNITVETKGDEFKINNNYTADYARLFMQNHPQYHGFFFLRERRADDIEVME